MSGAPARRYDNPPSQVLREAPKPPINLTRPQREPMALTPRGQMILDCVGVAGALAFLVFALMLLAA